MPGEAQGICTESHSRYGAPRCLFPRLVLSWTYWGTLQLSQPHFIPGQDITIAARSTLNEPNVLWGMQDGLIYDFTFDNVVIAGEKIDSLDQFYHNEFVLPLIIP